jgi:hypothetical protein
MLLGEVAMFWKSGPIDTGGWRPNEDIGTLLLKGATFPEGLPRPYVVVPKPLKEWEEAKRNIRAMLKGLDAVRIISLFLKHANTPLVFIH